MAKEIIYEKIYRDIKNDIKEGILKPGDRVKSEIELAEEYGVSRITSKKAMELLANEHLVTRTRGKGSFVESGAKDIILKGEESNKPGAHIKSDTDTNVIGVLFDTFGEDFGSELLRAIERECHRRNIQMIFRCTYGSIAEEDAAIERFLGIGAKGMLILCAQGENYNNTIVRLALDEYPIVLVDRPMKGIPIPCIKTDNYKAAEELTNAIIKKKHTNICFVTHSSLDTPTISERYAGFTDAILENKKITGLFEQMKTYQIAEENMYIDNLITDEAVEILERHPECTAYLTAEYRIGVLLDKAARDLGRKIDIATFDSISPFYDDRHEFMYVTQDEKQMGEVAVSTLVDSIQGKKSHGAIHIPYRVVDMVEK